jgi:hypothetical protein
LTTIASKLAPTEEQMAAQPCRSELAREKPENAAGYQASRVIVDDHREQARSYRRTNGSTTLSEQARAYREAVFIDIAGTKKPLASGFFAKEAD